MEGDLLGYAVAIYSHGLVEMASAVNNSAYDTIVAGTGSKFTVLKDIPVLPGNIGTLLKVGSIITVNPIEDYGGKVSIRFTVDLPDNDATTAVPNGESSKYLTTEYLKPKTAGGRRRTRKHKRRHTKKRKQSRRRKN